MKPPIPIPTNRTYGARLSATDVVVLLLAAAGAWWMHRAGHELWWVVLAVVGHFFLFCNVFLVRRSLELIWAGIFVCNMGWWMAQGKLGWWPVMMWQVPVTVVVITVEMLSPSYHGIGARWINRRLDDYLNERL